MDTITLEKLKFGVIKRLSTNGIENTNVEIEELSDMIGDQVSIAIRGFIWAETDPVERVEVKYPRDWLEAVKERFAPRWFSRRHPVIYTTKYLELKAAYPDFRPAYGAGKVRFIVQKGQTTA